MKRVFAIHDMSGIGKCSLSAALPIISACGVECNPIPTAILSTHTGEIEGYTFKDLTDNIEQYYEHWLKLSIYPDAIYSGYLGSVKQIEIISNLISKFRKANPIIIVDPAMADSGKLYKGFNGEFVDKIKILCSKADLIIPNLTEACLLTNTPYKSFFSAEEINNLISKLNSYSKQYIVLTGVSNIKDKTGCAVYDKHTNEIKYFSSNKYPGLYYGTGDIFASVLTGMLMKGNDIFSSAEKAVAFTSHSIEETYNNQTDPRFGVAFEKFLNELN